MSKFEPTKMLAALNRHGVVYVIIGGLAATIHGSPHATLDLDLTPQATMDNAARLHAALKALGAALRDPATDRAIGPLPGVAELAHMRLPLLSTRYGDLDVVWEPSGTRGYDDLVRAAAEVKLGKLTVRVAALADVVRSKEAAGRSKDLATLPTLRALLAVQSRPRRPRR